MSAISPDSADQAARYSGVMASLSRATTSWPAPTRSPSWPATKVPRPGAWAESLTVVRGSTEPPTLSRAEAGISVTSTSASRGPAGAA